MGAKMTDDPPPVGSVWTPDEWSSVPARRVLQIIDDKPGYIVKYERTTDNVMFWVKAHYWHAFVCKAGATTTCGGCND